MQKAKEGLRKVAGIETPPAEPPKPETPPKVEEKPTPKPTETPKPPAPTPKPAQETPEAKEKGETAPKDGKTPAAPEDGAKEGSPWRLVKTLQAQNGQLVRELTQLKAGDKGSLAQIETLTKRAEAAEKRRDELESEIRYVDFSKSAEFAEKFKKPLDEAWTRAASDLSELTITDEEGVTRQATVHDMVALAQLPLSEASRRAKDWFGDAATDMMAHRRQLRDLSAAQEKALEEARKTGDERQKQTTADRARVQDEVRTLWTQNIVEEQSRRDFLQEIEGDETWNKKLAEAVNYVDTTIQANPHDPKLTPEQRLEVIKRHASIRNRAVGFAMRGIQIKRLQADLKAAQAELAEFKKSEPPAGPGAAPGEPSLGASGLMEQAKARLRSLGKPS